MEFDKNVKIPVGNLTRIGTLKSMAVGDSFLVRNKAEVSKWRQAMTRAADTGECHFVSKAVAGGVRIWRDA